MSKSLFRYLLRGEAQYLRWYQVQYRKLFRWRIRHWRKVKHINNLYRLGRINSKVFFMRWKKLWVNKKIFYQKWRTRQTRHQIRWLTLQHRRRIRKLRNLLNKKKLSHKAYRKKVRFWTQDYNWLVNIKEKWLKIRNTYHNKYRIIQLAKWNGKISYNQQQVRIYKISLPYRKGFLSRIRSKFIYSQKWRRITFLKTSRYYRKMYRKKKWGRSEFLGRMNCLKEQYYRRRNSYIRWNRFKNKYYNTIWRSSNLWVFKKISRKAHFKDIANISRVYRVKYREHLRILRILSKNCFKKLAKHIKIWRRLRRIRQQKLRLRRIRKIKLRNQRLIQRRSLAYFRWLRENKR